MPSLMVWYFFLATCSARISELCTLCCFILLVGVAPSRSPANTHGISTKAPSCGSGGNGCARTLDGDKAPGESGDKSTRHRTPHRSADCGIPTAETRDSE